MGFRKLQIVLNSFIQESFQNVPKFSQHLNKIISLAILSLLFVFISSCKNDPIKPDEDKPGRRDYVWTIDTLRVPEGRTIPYWMWGSGADNIWTIGSAYLNAYCIWHYDGVSWQNYSPESFIDPRGICGLNSSDIWTASTDGYFWHFNGTKWARFSKPNIPGFNNLITQSIAGSSKNNIYSTGFADSVNGTGYKAIVMQYDGNSWTQVNIPDLRATFTEMEYSSAYDIFIIKQKNFENSLQIFYSFNGNELIEFFNKNYGDDISLNLIRDKVYLVSEKKILRYEPDGLVLIQDFTNTQYSGKVWGRNEKDFFTINWDGIGHFNGTDLVTIYPKQNENWFPSGGIVFENEVFFIWTDSFNTFIIHGKLNG